MPVKIQYSSGDSSLGEFFFAVSESGLVMLEPGVSINNGLARLQIKYPEGCFTRSDAELREVAQALADVMDMPGATFSYPLAPSGSEFEMKVWALLREIPAGRRISYGELAKQMGQPREAQKIAQACAANTIAVLIPCHRVVKKDGSLSGFRWGYWRKKLLLERECSTSAMSADLNEPLRPLGEAQ
ncbi:methylated-DNA--[protein]-cysteine S-methyltransferase [Pantoea sp. EABMAA-21]|uniref:methylated-DNA--[protein]-cysteine S-methyltransferase n=1 Tax=Pantoea sp. EABMAA-21 TaxID=3043302 RepID=UPI0024B5A522|nr:methylated-DNA--[protein]-cysteine S-methyltransferase [Pantoea sp. EABMAA-21]MDI9280116.1 methylated-DNA--[protein]-cysteine S-methyltransferase [Pantoea sp. EABMAA-21]